MIAAVLALTIHFVAGSTVCPTIWGSATITAAVDYEKCVYESISSGSPVQFTNDFSMTRSHFHGISNRLIEIDLLTGSCETKLNNCEFIDIANLLYGPGVMACEATSTGMITATITGCTFLRCNVGSSGTGAAFYLVGLVNVEISQCHFHQCSAYNGGAFGIAAYTGTNYVRITDCEFVSNTAIDSGGAIYLYIFSGVNLIFTSNKMCGNSSPRGNDIYSAPNLNLVDKSGACSSSSNYHINEYEEDSGMDQRSNFLTICSCGSPNIVLHPSPPRNPCAAPSTRAHKKAGGKTRK